MLATPQALLQAALAACRRGDRAAAERKYRQAIRARPGDADAHYLLGVLRLEAGDPSGAAGSLERAVAAAAKSGRRVDPGWRLALGSARQRIGGHEGALEAFEAALRDAPDSVDALFCRATALQELGRVDEAVAGYEAVLGRAPNHAQAANNLGTILSQRGNPAAAIAAFRRAVAAQPDYADALANLGNALLDAGAAAEAVPMLRAAAEAHPDDAALHRTLLDCLVEEGAVEEVVHRAERFLAVHPDEAGIAAALGDALLFLGRKDQAMAAFRQALAADPACSRANQGLAGLVEDGERDALAVRIRTALDAPDIEDSDAAGLCFALATLHSNAGRHAEAFAAAADGNALKRVVLARRGYAYDRAAFEAEIEAIRGCFPPGSLDEGGADGSDRPLFVLGMPRSGTTLVEQILAAHPRVFAGGELGLMAQIAAGLRRRADYPASSPDGSALRQAAAFYLSRVGRLDAEAARITDKMPGNVLHIGLIARMFPHARIVHCRRDAMDTCVSCFMQNFRAATLSWSCDLGDTAHQYGQYRRLMEHWRAVLPPGRMLEVDYEETVADLEGQARRIVAFAGLPWDDACLRFQEAERAVTTASHSQVRRGLYSSSVGRWKRYGDGVLPLARALDACGCGPRVDA